MKILYVLNNALGHGGIESVVFNYYKYLSEKVKIEFALHSTIEDFENNDIIDRFRSKGVIFYRVTPRGENLKKNHEDLKKLFEKGYDIVHVHADAAGADVLSVARKCGVKYRIAHSHNTRFLVKPDSIKNLIKVAFLTYSRYNIRRQATGYMACSRVAGEWLFGKKNVSKTYILNNAIDTDKYAFSEEKRNKIRKELGLENAFVIGHVGRFHFQKNHEFLFKTFKIVLEKEPSAKLLLIGEGVLMEQMKQKAADDGIASSVIFYGDAGNVNEMLSAMDIFAFPSRFEGLSVALIEAQANGLHCIVSDAPTVTKDSDLTGQIDWLDTDSPEKWADKIMECRSLRHTGSADRIAENGFELKVEAGKLLDYYMEVVKGNNGKN